MGNSIQSIPNETRRAARSVFGESNVYLRLGEQLEHLLSGIDLATFEVQGVENRQILALITFFQAMEGLTDLQAVEALRTRIEWKYALHLPVNGPSFQAADLCQFRRRVLLDSATQRSFQSLMDQLYSFSFPEAALSPEAEARSMVSRLCAMNQIDNILRTMQETLETLAASDGHWLRRIALPHWYGRYNPSLAKPVASILPDQYPRWMNDVASDIHHLLEQIDQLESVETRDRAEVWALRQVSRQLDRWQEQPAQPMNNCATSLYGGCIYQIRRKGG